MIGKFKKNIISLIGNDNYKKLSVNIYRMMNGYHSKKYFNIDKENCFVISKNNQNIFLGYYDNPSCIDNKVLFLNTTDDYSKKAKIYYYDIETKESVMLSSTNAWNTQMGSRLRWISNNEIIFNDYNSNIGYISKILNIDTKIEKIFKFPIYDISFNNKYSFYLNFSVLNQYRPGYGYKCENDFSPDNGIYRGSFLENSSKKILSLEDIIKYKKNNYILSGSEHYINHICVSKFDNVLIFFHLWKDKKDKMIRNRVFLIDFNGKILNVLDDFDKASHYTFKSKTELLLTTVVKNKCQYRLYNIYTGKYKLLNFLNVDGHPTYIDEEKFITDTYPDHNGMQHIYLCNEFGIIKELVQMYHNPTKIDEFRCDLHPRYYNNILTFDSLCENNREENIIKINLENIREEDNIKKFKTKLSHEIYKNIYQRVDVNPLSLIYAKNFDFSYKAHLLLIKMLHTRNNFVKTLRFNKLQKKYSIWISPDCKIGSNFHMMHLDGIVIGSGVIIGNNCTIYHQVTIGKEKDKFPIIGHNVTIYSGAKIIGGIKIGNNCIIGANAVVTKDIPDNCVAVGIPAKIIKKGD